MEKFTVTKAFKIMDSSTQIIPGISFRSFTLGETVFEFEVGDTLDIIAENSEKLTLMFKHENTSRIFDIVKEGKKNE
jgi:hypothetical protein